jgi:hypothetical protein
MSDLRQIGELEKNASSKIIFSVTEYKGAYYVDVREFVKTANYEGFTKKGLRFHREKLDDFMANLRKVKMQLADLPDPGQEDAES